MPDEQGRLFAEDIAVQLGITVGDWRARVSRGYAPKVADRVVHGGAVRSVWDPQQFAEYLERRKQRLAAGEQVLQAIERQDGQARAIEAGDDPVDVLTESEERA
jgi:hypothetical protein